jgi:hypothetical protein
MPVARISPVTHPAPRPLRTIGHWHEMAPSPFASVAGTGAWTRHRAIVVSPDERKAASYDPVTDQWRLLPGPPRSFPQYGDAVWTGEEVLFVGGAAPDDAPTIGVAYDPHAATWRRLSPSPLADYEAAVWAGGRLVVAASRGQTARDGIAAYDPTTDAWTSLPEPPMTSQWLLVGAGDCLVAYGFDWLAHATPTLAIMDMATGTWGPLIETPLGRDAGKPTWTDNDQLLFLGGQANAAGDMVAATYDIRTGAWLPVDDDCGSGTGLWTGRWMLGRQRVFDPAREQCYRTPRSHDRSRRRALQLWTGQELLVWSGGGGEELPALPDGKRYRLPAWAATPGLRPVGRGQVEW